MTIHFKRYLDRQVTDILAFAAVKAILNGQARAARELAADCGEWQPLLKQLLAAQRSGGDYAALTRFRKLRQDNDAFDDLLAAYMEGVDPAHSPQTVHNLLELPTSDTPFFIPNLLPVGLSILAGRPKVGKSWLALQLAAAVATDSPVLGFPATQLPRNPVVAYYALEDSPRRLAERLTRQRISTLAYLAFYTTCRFLDGPGFQQFATAVQPYSFIIVDTFLRALSPNAIHDPLRTIDVLQRLHHLAQERNAAILLIDHHRKAANATHTTRGPASSHTGNPIDDILGGTAKAGIIDAAYGLYRDHGDNTALLRVSSRDFPELELRLQWDPATCTWSNCGDNNALTYTERQQEILDALTTLGPTPLGQLAAYTGQDKSNLCHRLQKLIDSGVVVKTRSDRHVILYARPGAPEQSPDGQPLAGQDPEQHDA